MFYKKEYQACLAEKNVWREKCFSLTDDLIALRQDVRKLRGLCDWLENENGRLRKKEAFTFDKAEFRRLENENRELKKRIRALENGKFVEVKKW